MCEGSLGGAPPPRCEVAMKYLLSGVVLLAIGALFLFNSVWFQAFFLGERFYDKIYESPFDVTTPGESLTIPILNKYSTRHSLALSVPDRHAFDYISQSSGMISYRFVSKGKVIDEGKALQLTRMLSSYTEDSSSVRILFFDLPKPTLNGELQLELSVDTPVAFLLPYKGEISCYIRPDYSPKANSQISKKNAIQLTY